MRNEPEAHYGLYLRQLEKNRIRDMEDGKEGMIDFGKIRKVVSAGAEVVPIVVQDADSKEVLILAYANRKAIGQSLTSGTATFWSTSRKELWVKGLKSGNTLELVEVRVNCEQNSLLYLVRRCKGGACHVKDKKGKARSSCYYRRLLSVRHGKIKLEFVEE